MAVARRLGPERLEELEVLGRIRQVILAADDVRNLHLDVIDDVNEMKDPRAVRPANGHVRMRLRIAQIEGDAAADFVVHRNRLARRAEAPDAVVLVEVAGRAQLLEMREVNGLALALEVRPIRAAGVRAFIPIEPEPA